MIGDVVVGLERPAVKAAREVARRFPHHALPSAPRGGAALGLLSSRQQQVQPPAHRTGVVFAVPLPPPAGEVLRARETVSVILCDDRIGDC